MTIRAGMTTIIDRLRGMTEAEEVDTALATNNQWNDVDMQLEVDRFRTRVSTVRMIAQPDNVAGSSQDWKRYSFPYAPDGRIMIEGSDDGESTFSIRTSTGALISLSDFSLNLEALEIVFSADQEGTDYYFSGFKYDMNKAAGEIWRRKAARVWNAINFAADGARFNREKLQAHCLRMAQTYEEREGIGVVEMVRTDLNPSGDDSGFF